MISLEDRFTGCLMGTAVGDALGAPFEGCAPGASPYSPGEPLEFHQAAGHPPGQYTDDTQMTFAIVRAILKAAKVDGAVICVEFARLWENNEIIGPGASCTDAMRRVIRLGAKWNEAGCPVGRAGNGTAMRSSPIGLWDYDRPEKIDIDAAIASFITHRDDRAAAGAVAVARAVAFLARNENADAEELISGIAGGIRKIHAGFSDEVERLREWRKLDVEDALSLIAVSGKPDQPVSPSTGITPYVIPTVLAAIFCFLRTPESFSETVTGAINAGGDADTTAAIAGALSGTHNGIGGIPRDLVEGVKDSAGLRALAGRFYRLTAMRPPPSSPGAE